MNYCIANWKMNKTLSESIKFLEEFKKKDLQNIKSKIILCPSFTSLKILETHLTGTKIELGSQNVHQKKRGAYTGEISVEMLKEIECEWVILGHSERRQYFLEEDVIINDKMNTVIENDLKPILCIGENESQRNKNETFDSNIPKMVSTGKGRTTCSYFLPDNKHIIYASTHLGGGACPPKPDYSRGYVWKLYPDYDIFKATRDGKVLHLMTDSPGYDAEATVAFDGS